MSVYHFVLRMWERHGVAIPTHRMSSLAAQVGQDIKAHPERVVDTQPDGRILVVTNLGEYGEFPLVYSPENGHLVTVLTWRMLKKYSPEIVKDKHEQQRRAAEQLQAGGADTNVEDLP